QRRPLSGMTGFGLGRFMAVVETLSVLALKPLAAGAAQAGPAGSAEAVTQFLARRFADHSQRLLRVLVRANERAWRAVEVALGGNAIWEACKGKLDEPAGPPLRRQLQASLASTPPAVGIAADPFYRKRCIEQVRAAHKAGLLVNDRGLDAEKLAHDAALLVPFTDGRQRLQAEWRAAAQLADELDRAGCTELAQVIRLEPQIQPPLLAL